MEIRVATCSLDVCYLRWLKIRMDAAQLINDVLIALHDSSSYHFFFELIILAALERKISVRANREELVQKGILLPESPTSALSIAGKYYSLAWKLYIDC